MSIKFTVNEEINSLPDISDEGLTNLDKSINYVYKNFNTIFRNVKSEDCSEILEQIDILSKYESSTNSEEGVLFNKLVNKSREIAWRIIYNRCHLCVENIATTTEHTFKNSLLKHFTDPNELSLYYKDSKLIVKAKNTSKIKIKEKNLCEECNSKKSKKADHVFDVFVRIFYEEADKLFQESKRVKLIELNTAKINNEISKYSHLEEEKGTDSILKHIHRDEYRQKINITNDEKFIKDVKSYCAKLMACQLQLNICPQELRDIFFGHGDFSKLNVDVYYLLYDFKKINCETIFSKSDVIGFYERTPVMSYFKRLDSCIFEISVGSFLIQMSYNIKEKDITKELINQLYPE